MCAKKILVVDDEQPLVELLTANLEREGYEVISAGDGLTAIELAEHQKPDLILLDWMLPKLDGFEVCKRLRPKTTAPIIMVTAKGEEIDKILGLELGADDYIVKPFSPREVIARIKAVLRRFGDTQQTSSVLKFPGLEINLGNYSVKVKGETVPCTPKEVEILYLLASHPGQVYEREQILESVWGFDYSGDYRTVDTHIKRIRQKIAFDGASWSIQTIYGVGYKFEAD